MITTIFFDLDGTLLPMDLDIFTKAYISSLSSVLSEGDISLQKKIADGTMAGVYGMVKNDGHNTNERVFWQQFDKILPAENYRDSERINHYYNVEFQKISSLCPQTPKAAEIIKTVKQLGFRTVLATNPLFPSVATISRIRWAGLSPDDFEYITSYENSCYCKPSLGYYTEILKKLGLKAEECLMVGNDTGDDMVAKELGMKVFLLTDCLINKGEKDISLYPLGSFDELKKYISGLNEK